jgi:hypothetical protein
MRKDISKYLDIADINYILKEYGDSIPEDLINDFMFKLYEYVPVEESK